MEEKSRRTIIFLMSRPMLNGLRTIPLLQRKIRAAGDFACFFDSPVGIECIKGAVVIMHLPANPDKHTMTLLQSKFSDPKFCAISESFDRVKVLRCLSGFKHRLAIKEFGEESQESIFFQSLEMLEKMQQDSPPTNRKKVVILAPFDDAPAFRRKWDYEGLCDSLAIPNQAYDLIWLDDPADFIADDSTYVVAIDTPGCASTHPAIYSYMESHRNQPNVIRVLGNTPWRETGILLAGIMR